MSGVQAAVKFSHDETAQLIGYGACAVLAGGLMLAALLWPQILEAFDNGMNRAGDWLERKLGGDQWDSSTDYADDEYWPEPTDLAVQRQVREQR